MAKVHNRMDAELRFWLSVATSKDSCWTWCASLSTNGYGRIRYGGKAMAAHRVSWLMHYGTIPDGMLVCHKCDNPVCVRPDHLFLGTHQDNMDDMVAKGRAKGEWQGVICLGEHNGQSKLTDRKVRFIRRAWKMGKFTQRQLATRVGVDPSLISYVVRRKTWKHVA